MGKEKSVLLLGGRRKARAAAAALLRQGYRVTAVNKSREDCLMLAEIEGLNVLCGDAARPAVLAKAGAAGCDMAIALTDSDADNLVVCQLCKRRFSVPYTVSLLEDPDKTEFFGRMGVDRVLCAVSLVLGDALTGL